MKGYDMKKIASTILLAVSLSVAPSLYAQETTGQALSAQEIQTLAQQEAASASVEQVTAGEMSPETARVVGIAAALVGFYVGYTAFQ
jgi:hypothetical protein